MPNTKLLAQNKKAQHDYTIIDTYEAGIVLTGTEIKSVRKSQIQLRDGFVRILKDEAWLTNVYIAPFDHGNIFNVDELRTRKLLLKRAEINKLSKEMTGTGMTLIPLKAYIQNGRAKILIGLAQGKKKYDKRETLKRKEQNRDIARSLKERVNG